MSILLTPIKWLAMFVLILLGIALGALLLVLLVPIRYKVEGKRLPEGGEMSAKGKVSWLCSLVSLTFQYQQEFSWKVKILGIPLKLGQEDLSYEEEWEEELVEEWFQEEGAHQPFAEPFIPDPTNNQDVLLEPVLQIQDTEEMPGLSKRLKQMWSDLWEKLKHLGKTLASIPDKVRKIKTQAQIWQAFVKSPEFKSFISNSKKQLKKLLHHILPTKLVVTGNFGFADPSLTGQITGLLCMLPQHFQKHIQVHPHFQEECLDGHILVKGRIRAGSLLMPLLAVLVKPTTWKVYQRYKRITDPSSEKRTSQKKAGKKGKKKSKRKSKKQSAIKGKNATPKNQKHDPHKGGI